STAPGATYLRLSVLERLRRWICAHPAGELLDVSVRRLARLLGCAAGAISPALRRLAADGLIDYLAAPSGSLVEVLISDAAARDQEPDRPIPLPVSDQAPDRPTPADSAPPPAPRQQRPPSAPSDHSPDRQPCNKEHADSSMQQQPRACDEDLPGGLTATEWGTIRQLAPAYTLVQFRADLAKLAARADIRHPIGLIVAALRRGEPIWGRDELRARNAAVAAQHAPADAAPPPGPRSRPQAAPAAPAAQADAVRLAPNGALWDLLLLTMRDADLVDWLCEGLDLEMQADAILLHCRDVDRLAVARDLRGLLVDALRDLGLPDVLEILPPPVPAVTAPPTVPPDTRCHPAPRPRTLPPAAHPTATWRHV
ncbi:MAG TPA: hypothetical protein VFS21_36320, partial [Roseiflexaceae bacterium]|nr:hypothetical protein [Roseiflexaceae bacterium]